VFSPDNRHILFSSNRSGNLDIWQMDVDSGELTRVTDHAGQDWDPAYTPDGKSILWSSDRSGVFEVWQAANDGTGARQVSRDGVDAENPTMTRDGQWIVYLSGRPGHAGAWKMRADGSEATPLVRDVNLPDMAPDADIFAGPEGTGQSTGRVLRAYRISDGTPLGWEIRLPFSFNVAVGRPRWFEPRRLAYVDRDESGYVGVTVRDVTDHSVSAPRVLAGFDPLTPTESFAVTRDGSRVVLSVLTTVSSIAVAENVTGIAAGARR
jgi:dipeptidyl aminopeptidase/acylaminoacyl peptidase